MASGRKDLGAGEYKFANPAFIGAHEGTRGELPMSPSDYYEEDLEGGVAYADSPEEWSEWHGAISAYQDSSD
jgi:hypothetical protein